MELLKDGEVVTETSMKTFISGIEKEMSACAKNSLPINLKFTILFG